MLYQLISTFSGEPPVNEQVACPVIVIKTLIIKLKPTQEKNIFSGAQVFFGRSKFNRIPTKRYTLSERILERK